MAFGDLTSGNRPSNVTVRCVTGTVDLGSPGSTDITVDLGFKPTVLEVWFDHATAALSGTLRDGCDTVGITEGNFDVGSTIDGLIVLADTSDEVAGSGTKGFTLDASGITTAVVTNLIFTAWL